MVPVTPSARTGPPPGGSSPQRAHQQPAAAERLAHPAPPGDPAASGSRSRTWLRARDCARSFSWCGNCISRPSPWMSNVPRYRRRAIAGYTCATAACPVSQAAVSGLPGLAIFHARSRGSFNAGGAVRCGHYVGQALANRSRSPQ